MQISFLYSGVPQIIQVKIKPDFIPDTKLALTWFQLANDAWAATDRVYDQDTYDCNIRIYGKEVDVQAIAVFIEGNRTAGDDKNVLTLSNFNSQEHIFGADVDYSGDLTATAFIDRRGQKTWRGFEQTLRLSCVSPSWVGGSGSLPQLKLLDIGYDADSDREINKFDTYNRTFSYQEHKSDTGLFSGVYTFTNEEMIQIRRYVAIQRSASIPMPTIIGVAHPFGRRIPSSYVKITEFEDMGMLSVVNGVPRWKAKITLAEAV
jgi:hypothetical protein